MEGLMVSKYDDEEDFGAVGKIGVPEKKVRAKTYTVGVVPKRRNKPVEKWTGYDLGMEFASKIKEMFPDLVAQANPVTCVKIFSKTMDDRGISPQEFSAAMDLFFDDERNFRDLGKGQPVWAKFLSSFPYIQAQARRNSGIDKFDWEAESRDV
jgi:hypothetical protein